MSDSVTEFATLEPEHSLDLPVIRRGKVRDVYEMPPARDGEPRVLMVASDRISAFDVIMPTPITGKGRLLTEISTWWFGFIRERRLAETHLLSTDWHDIPKTGYKTLSGIHGEHATQTWLAGRVTIARRCRVVPIECVVRGFLEGSGWREYQATGEVCGVKLPKGLRQCDKLPEPIFTPATKAAVGHDENISFERACEIAGMETMGYLRDTALKIYKAAAEHAAKHGIIIADTKFEFGVPEIEVARQRRTWVPPILIDEALTPDSSRFWPAAGYEPGRAQKSFDKQFLREYLETLVKSGEWDKTDPGPELPPEVVEGTLARYREACTRVCGKA